MRFRHIFFFSLLFPKDHAKWYVARNALLGYDWEKTDVRKGLKLATQCIHPNAYNLLEVCFSVDPDDSDYDEPVKTLPRSEDEAVEAYMKEGSDFDLFDEYWLEDQGYDARRFICSVIIDKNFSTEVIEEHAIQVGERGIAKNDALIVCAFGRWYLNYKKDVPKALHLFEMAANLGNRVGQYYYGLIGFGEDQPMRYFWWTKVLERRLYGEKELRRTFFGQIVQWLCKGDIPDDILFQMGGALKIHFDDIKQVTTKQEEIAAVQEAISFYDCCYDKAQEAIQYWLLAGNQFLVKRMTVKIAQILWSEKSAWGTVVRGRTTTHQQKKVRRQKE